MSFVGCLLTGENVTGSSFPCFGKITNLRLDEVKEYKIIGFRGFLYQSRIR